jgi:flagellar hook protein FlgE
MSLNGIMRTGVSGMSAQSTRLSSIADNIANNDTTGYKRSSIEFANLVGSGAHCPGHYVAGGVDTRVRMHISEQGSLEFTSSKSDLAINGEGFFLVDDGTGFTSLTRAGSFVQDGEGYLVNAAGQYLMGYPVTNDTVDVVANGSAGLERVQLQELALQAQASTEGALQVNLPAEATVVAPADLPSVNAANSTFTQKTSLVVYDNLGAEKLVDVYWAKTADETWEVAVYDSALSTNGGFPYSAGALTTATVTFDPANGQLLAPASIAFAVPDGQPFTLDIGGSSQLAADYAVLSAVSNGQAPAGVESVSVASDGSLVVTFQDGTLATPYRIPLATVNGTDLLSARSGNLFNQSIESGTLRIGFPQDPGFGFIQSGALEQSNVDLGDELTQMIESQRNYSANSKVFQTGSELFDILVNLKR